MEGVKMISFDRNYDVVIIGSGLGGLTCAASLAKRGKKVLVLEQGSNPGGYGVTFQRKGYKFDAALHLIVGAGKGPLKEIFSSLSITEKLKFIPLDPLYTVIYPGLKMDIPADLGAYTQILCQEFPLEEAGIKTVLSEMDKISVALGSTPPPPVIGEYAKKTFADLLDEHLHDPRLKAIISSPWIYAGLPPSRLSVIVASALFLEMFTKGAYFPQGGSSALVDCMVERFKEAGGELELNSRVVKILLEEKRAIGVETAKGAKIGARVVISNAAANQTFLKLVGREALEEDFCMSLERMEVSLSVFQVYLGIKGDPKELGIPGHEVMLFKDYNYEGAYRQICQGDFLRGGLSITTPTMIDPSMAPEGGHSLICYLLAPYKGIDWKVKKATFMEELLVQLEGFFPRILDRIVIKDASTPLTFERYTLNTEGALLGWAATPELVFGRPQPKTPIENLYLTGHWTLPGGGYSGVIPSGWMVAEMVSEYLG
jgi:prolycopene isomerase